MPHIIYTVQQADEAEGLLGIARDLYEDEARWTAIYDANRVVIGNNPTVVRAGQQLVLPDLIAGGQQHSHHVYPVQLHDVAQGLRGIAQQLWAAPERWHELYAVNKGVIGDDPRQLQPGQWLIVP